MSASPDSSLIAYFDVSEFLQLYVTILRLFTGDVHMGDASYVLPAIACLCLVP